MSRSTEIDPSNTVRTVATRLVGEGRRPTPAVPTSARAAEAGNAARPVEHLREPVDGS